MQHISNLPDNVLVLILLRAAAATPAKNLSEWKTKLPLLAVCRTWTNLAQSIVFYHVYVEFTTPPNSRLGSHLLWTSNADLFISRGCVLTARHLTIEWAGEATIDHIRSVVLDTLKLDRVDWQHINSLVFAELTRASSCSDSPDSRIEQAVTDTAHIVQCFERNLRNVVKLKLYDLNRGPTGECLYASLITSYGYRLQVLHARSHIPFPSSCYMKTIKLLELNLDSAAARVLPSMCGETLKVMKLVNVPRNFAWHYFRYDVFVRAITFRQLTHLHLAFEDTGEVLTKDEMQEKVDSGANNCYHLEFPALKQLTILNCTPDCDLLYADIQFPELEKVVLSGPATSICHCSRLKLVWVRDLHVTIFRYVSGNAAGVYRATNHFFTNICIGRTASLRVMVDWFILDPDVMRWANITKLEVGMVDYVVICQAISQLPNLCELAIYRLKLTLADSGGFTIDSSLFISADPIMSWGKRLTTVKITRFYEDYPLPVSAHSIQALIRNAGALNRLDVPESTKRSIVTFINEYVDRYPYLANITIY